MSISHRRGVIATLVVAAMVGTGLAVALPAAAEGREVGGGGTAYFLNDSWSPNANTSFTLGLAGDRVYVGDWNGDGKDTLMLRRGSTYYVTNAHGGPTVQQFTYGRADDVVIVGDWDGNGTDTIAIRRGNSYLIKNRLGAGNPDKTLTYGRLGDDVLVGDWDGNGTDTLAVRRDGNWYFLKNTIASGNADNVLTYGRAADMVFVGDFDGNRTDTLTVRRGNTYFAQNTLRGGNADIVQDYGRVTDTVLVGDWNGDRKDTLGVRRQGAIVAPTIPKAPTAPAVPPSPPLSNMTHYTFDSPASGSSWIYLKTFRVRLLGHTVITSIPHPSLSGQTVRQASVSIEICPNAPLTEENEMDRLSTGYSGRTSQGSLNIIGTVSFSASWLRNGCGAHPIQTPNHVTHTWVGGIWRFAEFDRQLNLVSEQFHRGF